MTGSRPRSIAVVLRVGGAAVAVAAAAASFITPARAQEAPSTNTFVADIEAHGMAIAAHGDKLPLTTTLEVSPWAALAHLDNTQSLGQAGAPYLGDFLTPIIGLANALGSGGNLPPLPDIPGYVNTSHPDRPDQSQANGPYLIESRSRESSVHAAVKLGAMATGSENASAFSAADAEFESDGTLTAKGAAGVDLLNVGGVLDIANFSSSIEVTSTGDGEPEYKTKTNLGSVHLLGIPIGITEQGITAIGLGLPIDAASALAETALSSAGITLKLVPAKTHYVEGTKQVDFVESASLQIGLTQEVPTQGPVAVKLTLGRVVMRALNQANDDAAAAGGDAGQSGGAATGDLGATLPGADSGAVGDGGLGATLGGPTLGDLPAPGATPDLSAGGATGSGSQGGQGAAVATRRTGFTTVDNVSGVYLVLVLAGAASVGMSMLMRVRGVGG